MKRYLVFFAAALLCLNLQAQKALVVIAHGSPSEDWNDTVLALESRLDRTDIPGISYKRVALMEFAQPNIASVMRDCELQQIDTAFSVSNMTPLSTAIWSPRAPNSSGPACI